MDILKKKSVECILKHDKYNKNWFLISESICGGFMNSTLGTISSPNYPLDYSTNLNCTWLMIGPVKLQVHSLDLEFDSQCGFDALTVSEGVFSNDTYNELGRYKCLNYVVLVPLETIMARKTKIISKQRRLTPSQISNILVLALLSFFSE